MGRGPLLALLSALLLILSFPRFDLEFIAWIALVPLLIGLKGQGLKAAFGLSFLAGISFQIVYFYWMNFIDGFKWTHFLATEFYGSLYFPLFGVALNFISKKSNLSPFFTAPALWVSQEYLRTHSSFLSLPMPFLSHSQYLNIPLIQISAVTGAYGVSFLIVMVNAVLSEAVLLWLDTTRRNSAEDRRKLIMANVIKDLVSSPTARIE